MNALTPYAAFFMRLAVGGVFLIHGLSKFHRGIAAVAGFFGSAGSPFPTVRNGIPALPEKPATAAMPRGNLLKTGMRKTPPTASRMKKGWEIGRASWRERV